MSHQYPPLKTELSEKPSYLSGKGVYRDLARYTESFHGLEP